LETKKIVSLLKGKVTYFSEELKTKGETREDVTMGGIIISQVPVFRESVPLNYMFQVDDGVGHFPVYASPLLYDSFEELFQKGRLLLFSGYLDILISHDNQRNPSLYAYNVDALDKEESIL
jgi:hypothetical protein